MRMARRFVEVPYLLALDARVDGLLASTVSGAVMIRGRASARLSGVAHVSADGLVLGLRLYDLTANDWAGPATECGQTEPTAFEQELALPSAPHIYRLYLSLSGGQGLQSELGFVGSAQLQ